jgi:hypothetical protein
MNKIIRGFLVLAFSLTCAVPAARAASGPLFRVSGVVNALTLATVFSCTNTGTVATNITIQVFDASGAATGTQGMATLNPGASVLFGTASVSGFFISGGNNLNLPNTVATGSAQISSTQKTLMCTAIVTDSNSNPPVSMTTLTIISKTKQKGD